jgi:hypothetical protein
MRKAVCLTMVILFIATIITGIAEGHVHPGRSGVHTVMAVLFIITALTHVAVNRKSFFRHFMSLDKKAG